MTSAEQSREFDILANRAKKAGLLKALYPDERLMVVEVPPPPAVAESAPLTLEAQPGATTAAAP